MLLNVCIKKKAGQRTSDEAMLYEIFIKIIRCMGVL